MAVKEAVALPVQGTCTRCNFVSSQAICKACVLLEGLNKGLPRLGVGKSSKAKKILDEYNAKKDKECLEKAINDYADNDSCKSKGKPCRTGLCKTKIKGKSQHFDTNCCKENNDTNGSVEGYSIGYSDREKVILDREQENQKIRATNPNVDSDNEDFPLTGQDEENTCAGACGTMGSLNVGF